MNKITFILESDTDGRLGMEHGKRIEFSMDVTDNIATHADAFRSFLLAAAFPPKLVADAFNELALAKWECVASREASKNGELAAELKQVRATLESAENRLTAALDAVREQEEAKR